MWADCAAITGGCGCFGLWAWVWAWAWVGPCRGVCVCMAGDGPACTAWGQLGPGGRGRIIGASGSWVWAARRRPGRSCDAAPAVHVQALGVCGPPAARLPTPPAPCARPPWGGHPGENTSPRPSPRKKIREGNGTCGGRPGCRGRCWRLGPGRSCRQVYGVLVQVERAGGKGGARAAGAHGVAALGRHGAAAGTSQGNWPEHLDLPAGLPAGSGSREVRRGLRVATKLCYTDLCELGNYDHGGLGRGGVV